MAISQAESGLSESAYNSLKALETGATYRLTLQRINFVFTQLNGSASSDPFDACVVDVGLIRVKPSGNDLVVERTIGDTWSTVATITGAYSDSDPFAVFGEASTIRVYYYVGSDIKYVESTDSGDHFGAAANVGSLANAAHLAPSALGTLHVATYDDHNTHLYRYEDDTLTESKIYFPAPFSGFDAETVDGADVLVFAALGQVRYETSRQGVWAIRQKNGRWSDPTEIDVLDEYEDGQDERSNAMLSWVSYGTHVGRLLFCTYIGSDGGFTAACFSRSSGGWFWQHRQPLGALDFPGKLLRHGDYVYYVGAGLTYRSASTILSGHSTVNVDVTDRVESYGASRHKMHQSNIVLHNEDDALISLMGDDRWQVVEELGYFDADGTKLIQQVALTEVDVYGHDEDLPVDMIVLNCRDCLAWMADRTEADHYEEWESQLRHYDDFHNSIDERDQKEILYSGLRHTASMSGRWSTQDDELHLASTNKEGLALCSMDKFIAHTIVSEAIQIPTAGNNEWAGVVFRALDEDNYWCAFYDQATDRIKLRQKVEGEWQNPVAETEILGWSVATWYWIRVEARLSLFTVYYSTDGSSWTQALEYIDVTSSVLLDAFKEGYVGHNGFGFSDEDTEPSPPPSYPAPPPGGGDPDYDALYAQLVVGSRTAGVAYCPRTDFINSTPTWVIMNNGLGVVGSRYIYDLKIQKVAETTRYLWAGTKCGIYRYTLPAGTGSWTQMISNQDILTHLGAVGEVHVKCLVFSWADPNRAWASIGVGIYGSGHVHILKTVDGWNSIDSSHQISSPTSPSGCADLVVDRNNENHMFAHGGLGFAGYIWESTDGGVNWEQVPGIGVSWQGARLWWPYHDAGSRAYVATAEGNPNFWYSDNGGTSFTSRLLSVGFGDRLQRVRSRHVNKDHAWLASWQGIMTWNPATETFETFRGVGGTWGEDALCLRRLQNGTPEYFVLGGGAGGAAQVFLVWGDGHTDKSNNLQTILAPYADGQTDIDVIAFPDYYGGVT